jgi:predicted hotdog family 3-hydroxylacyl-ACP dehydratase
MSERPAQGLDPIEKDDIRALIPHAGRMCLLDRVLAWDEQSITCLSETHRDPANPLRRNGGLSALHAFEYGAQAVAVHGGLRARAALAEPIPGYLAGLRHARLHAMRLDDIDLPLEVRATRLFGEAANLIYESRLTAGNTLLAEGRIIIMPQVVSTMLGGSLR